MVTTEGVLPASERSAHQAGVGRDQLLQTIPPPKKTGTSNVRLRCAEFRKFGSRYTVPGTSYRGGITHRILPIRIQHGSSVSWFLATVDFCLVLCLSRPNDCSSCTSAHRGGCDVQLLRTFVVALGDVSWCSLARNTRVPAALYELNRVQYFVDLGARSSVEISPIYKAPKHECARHTVRPHDTTRAHTLGYAQASRRSKQWCC